MGPSVYGPKMRALGKWVAFNTSGCGRGHELRLKDRAGHCIQCDKKSIQYQRLHDEDGVVYIAYSHNQKLVKVGTRQRSDRIDQLNSERYGGASDWREHHSYSCAKAGKVEKTAHNLLSQYKADGQYFKNGSYINCNELFNCDLAKAVEAVEKAVARIIGEITNNEPSSNLGSSPDQKSPQVPDSPVISSDPNSSEYIVGPAKALKCR